MGINVFELVCSIYTLLLLFTGQFGLLGGFGVLENEIGRSSFKTEAHIPPLLGVAPLGPVPLSKDHQFQYRYWF